MVKEDGVAQQRQVALQAAALRRRRADHNHVGRALKDLVTQAAQVARLWCVYGREMCVACVVLCVRGVYVRCVAQGDGASV